MQYALVVTKGKDKELYKLYDNYEKAEKKLKKSFKENGTILEIPEVRAGLVLYRADLRYYGTIIHETKCLWLINDTDKMNEISTPILKEHIINFFIKGVFKDGIEEYDENYVNEYYKDEDDLEEMMDEIANDNDKIESEE
jgi:hypothetical protein